MLDLALPEQFDRLLFALLLGLVLSPMWLLAIRIGGRVLWRKALEIVLEVLLVALCVLALAIGTSFSLRAFVFIGFGVGLFVGVALLRGIRPPWEEFHRKRRT